MEKYLCIHGHFYQPPREDPWLGSILPEGSAAPSRHWNERILRESYAPMAWARRLDGSGRIADILNCYEWISFNAGPTLMRWLERDDQETYQRILDADKKSIARWGHGNALAQVYHHVIMPLASPRQRQLEIAWALDDFAHRFGRPAEGMWLAESAADVPTLEDLAAHGVRFTVLAPRQARRVSGPKGAWAHVDENSLDVRRPYRIELPSGKSISVFFYHGPISRAVAFEKLLQDGEGFWHRIAGAAGEGLLTLCTDGETYGHHFTFGEMALAHVLAQAYSGRDGIRPTNLAAYLANHPPEWKVELHEPSSWSCVHGVERWRSNCGCTDGGHPGWNQSWRGPLRSALNFARDAVEEHFTSQSKILFTDPQKALGSFGRVLCGELSREAYAVQFFAPSLSETQKNAAWKLLTMEEQMLAAYASCAWFFDEISRIEPVNALTYCLRALEIRRDTGGGDIPQQFFAELEKARSNKESEGTGKNIFETRVLPRHESEASLILQALLKTAYQGRLQTGTPTAASWPAVDVEVTVASTRNDEVRPDEAPIAAGTARIRWHPAPWDKEVPWTLHSKSADIQRGERHVLLSPPDSLELRVYPAEQPAGDTPPESRTASSVCRFEDLPWGKRQALAMTLILYSVAQRRSDALARSPDALALFLPWEEAQHDQPDSHLWEEFAPEMLLAMAMDAGPEDKRADAAASWLHGIELSSGARRRLEATAQQTALTLLEAPAQWSRLARLVRILSEYVPGLDWWPVQNKVWAMAPWKAEAAQAARALGFRLPED
ncbi:DUF3536 domain-containing protein [Oleidesulfovibrio sp.]|uniref:DUF3536 domain-containing protein n=1 Tax=Oleidesulfovibrio sp. TaxID=2909707 RepID=UPI003A85719A